MHTEPAWRRKLNGKVAKLRKDVSQLEKWKMQALRNNGLKEQLERTYNVKKKGIGVVIEEIKQRISATAAKIRRYDSRGNSTDKIEYTSQTKRDFLNEYRTRREQVVRYQKHRKAGNFGTKFGI